MANKQGVELGRLSLLLDALVTAATIVGVVFLVLQWGQTDDALKEARTANDLTKQAAADAAAEGAAQSLRNERQLKVAEDANRLTAAGLNSSIAAARLDQRAWLAPGPGTFSLDKDLTPGGTVHVTRGFINTGKTAAMNIREWTMMEFGGKNPFENFHPSMPLRVLPKNTGVVFPNNGLAFPAEPYVLPKRDVRAGNGGLWVLAIVRYDDVFGCHHVTQTCRVHVEGNSLNDFGVCQKGDEVETERDCGPRK